MYNNCRGCTSPYIILVAPYWNLNKEATENKMGLAEILVAPYWNLNEGQNKYLIFI